MKSLKTSFAPFLWQPSWILKSTQLCPRFSVRLPLDLNSAMKIPLETPIKKLYDAKQAFPDGS